MKAPRSLFTAALLWLTFPLLPSARAWDHATADAIRAQVLDAAVAAALPGYTYSTSGVGNRTLCFYYEGPAPAASQHRDSLELSISYRDGRPVVPLVNSWPGTPSIFGPVADLVGDEAVAYDGSREKPGGNGHWIRARVGSRSFFVRDSFVPFTGLTSLARTLAAALPSLPVPNSFEIEESEREQPNAAYIEADRAMLARITPGLLGDPPAVDVLAWSGARSDHDLGFGYRFEERGAAGGYLSVYGTVLLQGNSVEAVRLASHLPNDPAPIPLYRELLSSLFGDASRRTDAGLQRFWNYARAAEPLPTSLFRFPLPDSAALADHPDRAEIDWLMTPFSGLDYGTRGGYAMTTLANRVAVKGLSRPDAKVALYLLRSKNPVTRLTAVETLRLRAADWGVDLGALAQDFETVYASVPEVPTLRGCIMGKENARALVDEQVNGRQKERRVRSPSANQPTPSGRPGGATPQ